MANTRDFRYDSHRGPQRGSKGRPGGDRRHGMMGVVDLCTTCIQGTKALIARQIPSDWDPLVRGKGRQEDCCDSVSVEIGIPCILRAETNDQPYCESSSVRLPRWHKACAGRRKRDGGRGRGVNGYRPCAEEVGRGTGV